MTYVRSSSPPSALRFGVVCTADWLFNVSIRSTTHALARRRLPPAVSQREYQRPDVDHFVLVRPAGQGDEKALLAFGSTWPAYLVVTDDCAIETCRGRGQTEPADSVTFVPLRERVTEDPEDLTLVATLARFPLPGDPSYAADHVALLSHAFQVDSRHIWTDAGALYAGLELRRELDAETKDALLQRWAAHTARRGPLVAADNAGKLEELLMSLVGISGEAADLYDRLLDVADHTWDYEIGPLEAIAEAWEAWRQTGHLPDLASLLDQLRDRLSRVQEAAAAASVCLSAARAKIAED